MNDDLLDFAVRTNVYTHWSGNGDHHFHLDPNGDRYAHEHRGSLKHAHYNRNSKPDSDANPIDYAHWHSDSFGKRYAHAHEHSDSHCCDRRTIPYGYCYAHRNGYPKPDFKPDPAPDI